ncbi:MAG TPA: sodium:solute symporter family protein [Vicinamibacterales bacterium]|nr:sodium:solute symporter family protein [Vicinamibacterales bacterium]
MSLTLVLLVAYSILMAALGLWIGRRVSASGQFFVAGRTLGPGLVFATFLAGNIGAGSTVGAAGLAFRDGVSAWWWNASAGLGCLVLAFSVGPRMWRESIAHGDLTVGDFLERKYGPSLRLVVALLIWLGTLSILAAQLLGMSTVFQVVAGTSRLAGCAIGAAIVCVYFIAGGLLSSAYVNLVQLAVKLVGFALVAPMAVAFAGGLGTLTADPARLDVFTGGSPQSGWRLLFFLGPAFIVSPGLLQKAFGARDERAVTMGVALNGVALLLFAALPTLIGMSAYVLSPDINKDLAFATMASTLPPAFGAFALAAVFSAEASAADAVLFMLATSGSRDLYRRVRPHASDAELLRAARASAVAGAALGLALAMMHRSVIDALGTFYAVMVVTLFVPLLAGLYARRVSPRQGVASLAGVPVLAIVHFATGGAGYGALTPVIAGVLASAAGFAAMRDSSRRDAMKPGNPSHGR